LAGLPERQREYLSLLVAGFSYREIAELSGGRTLTNVNKHLAKARDRVAPAGVNGVIAPGPHASGWPELVGGAMSDSRCPP